jgi:dTDP-4-dehydrorhamnose 3,5-epimerase-like enzyme
MQIVREFKKISDRQIVIDLPDSFYAKEVEIIIIPYKKNLVDNKNNWKKDFLSISKWDITEEDIKIPSWKIEEF